MKEPIIVYENGALDIFESVEKAERYIEPIDVKIGDNVFYDSEGRVLQAFVEKDLRGIERTVIIDREEGEIDQPELKRILVDFLEYLSYSRYELEEMELFQLVKKSLKYKTE